MFAATLVLPPGESVLTYAPKKKSIPCSMVMTPQQLSTLMLGEKDGTDGQILLQGAKHSSSHEGQPQPRNITTYMLIYLYCYSTAVDSTIIYSFLKQYCYVFTPEAGDSKEASSDHVIDMMPSRSKAPSAVCLSVTHSTVYF